MESAGAIGGKQPHETREGEGGLVRGLGDEDKEAKEKEEEKKKKGMKKVLVAMDNSDGSSYALKWALDNLFSSVDPEAKKVEGDEEERTVILLHVLQPFQPYIAPAGPAIYASADLIKSVRKTQEQSAASLLGRASELCKGKGIKFETLVLDGEPKEMICTAAEDTHSDIIVVGSRGLGMFRRAFLGSVSDYCAHHAKCPILIVKPPK